jgi:hypothetical protein
VSWKKIGFYWLVAGLVGSIRLPLAYHTHSRVLPSCLLEGKPSPLLYRPFALTVLRRRRRSLYGFGSDDTSFFSACCSLCASLLLSN